jgi:hypothetical protein
MVSIQPMRNDSDSGDIDAEWPWSLDTSGVGVSGEYFANQNGVFPNIDGPYQMRLSTSSSVPDSGSTACLLGFGVVVLVVMRRSLVNKQAFLESLKANAASI